MINIVVVHGLIFKFIATYIEGYKSRRSKGRGKNNTPPKAKKYASKCLRITITDEIGSH